MGMIQSRSISHDSLDLYGKSMVEKSFCRKKIHIINVSVETGDTSQNNSLEIPFVHSKTTFTAKVKEI